MVAFFVLAPRFEADPAAFRAALAESKAPAVAAAVVKDGKTVWSGATGATGDTPFRIASLTKAFTATIVLQLVNEKKVALDDPIGKALPSLPEAWRGATIRQLLNHTSGIPSYTSLPTFRATLEKQLDPAGIVALTADKPLDFPSGTKFSYDNTGYIVLGMLVERFDRRPFADSLRRRILDPLGMKRTRLNPGGKEAESLGYDDAGKPAIAINMSLPYAAGSIVSTANDMARWLAAQGSPRLLPASLWNEAWTSGKLADGKSIDYGFGWEVATLNKIPVLQHSGGIPGFSTYAEPSPSKGLAVVALTNAEGGKPDLVVKRLLEAADPSLKSSEAAIPDPDPKFTEAAEKLFHSLVQGEPDRSLMSDEMSKAITSEAIERGKSFLAPLGEFKEMRLLSVEGLRRTYLVFFEKGKIRLNAVQNAEGKFSGFGIQPA